VDDLQSIVDYIARDSRAYADEVAAQIVGASSAWSIFPSVDGRFPKRGGRPYGRS